MRFRINEIIYFYILLKSFRQILALTKSLLRFKCDYLKYKREYIYTILHENLIFLKKNFKGQARTLYTKSLAFLKFYFEMLPYVRTATIKHLTMCAHIYLKNHEIVLNFFHFRSKCLHTLCQLASEPTSQRASEPTSQPTAIISTMSIAANTKRNKIKKPRERFKKTSRQASKQANERTNERTSQQCAATLSQ